MVSARALLWAICVLRVALATVYFQEEFLDGGEGDCRGGWWPVSTIYDMDPCALHH
jgi:hypothetical protein